MRKYRVVSYQGLMLFLLLSMLTGCGASSTGPERYNISGSVTYDGKPLTAGEITFEPDRSFGNSGPATSLLIKNGQYTSSGWKGIIGGPMIVRILGYDGVQPDGEEGEMLPNGRQLFDDYTESVELPRETATRDFNIPVKKRPGKSR
ncbi:hypothetical protein M4951_17065 [Blastopirellula sp. J2-11]|uniref:hypothetical protein n=1 Tax=Blastopirellula sp. J2-11 TaxID=2943192 RepID=UPI0021C749C1|nr:hypothetical protein [Blastopirellula sp. J2-11]UUO05089.1 hypothetical protein M4951_17065 [Blastopirellula sp. J2-11]